MLITGPVEAVEPPEEDEDGEVWNGRYLWQEGDTDEPADDYDVEVRPFWDATSTPPKRQTFPTKNPRPTLEIVKSNAV